MYEYLSDLGALQGAWEDLKSSARRPPADPRRHEDLLTAEHLLTAIRKIGPENAPVFYRTLAGAKKAELRLEAARQLIKAEPQDVEQNLAVLRNLAADPQADVQIAATFSLYHLHQAGAAEAIEKWLSSPEYEHKRLTLLALERVTDRARLAFVRPKLQAIVADPTAHEWLRDRASSLLRWIE